MLALNVAQPTDTVQTGPAALYDAVCRLHAEARHATPWARTELERKAGLTFPPKTGALIRCATAPRTTRDELYLIVAEFTVAGNWGYGFRSFVREVFRGPHANGNGKNGRRH